MKDSLKKLQIHLSKDHNLVLDYEQLEQIQSLVINTRDQSEHVGLFSERIKYNPKEEAFHKEWLKENEIKSHVNYGHGLLQDLFFDRERNCVLEINTRDRKVVATVIQWLGSNIGMMFLEKVLKTVGYKITKIDLYMLDLDLYIDRIDSEFNKSMFNPLLSKNLKDFLDLLDRNGMYINVRNTANDNERLLKYNDIKYLLTIDNEITKIKD